VPRKVIDVESLTLEDCVRCGRSGDFRVNAADLPMKRGDFATSDYKDKYLSLWDTAM